MGLPTATKRESSNKMVRHLQSAWMILLSLMSVVNSEAHVKMKSSLEALVTITFVEGKEMTFLLEEKDKTRFVVAKATILSLEVQMVIHCVVIRAMTLSMGALVTTFYMVAKEQTNCMAGVALM